MPTDPQATDVLNRHYLEIRCGLLDVAAALDRIERADNAASAIHDPRMELIHQGLRILTTSGNDRAESIQKLFSDEYTAGWNKK